ncbi:MAG: AAA family ATPase [Anaerolineales bacterium]|nr:AAA family ATPase [Anaerolineales bacterium]MCB9127513.1 AAA family ATPase [Ardenticatenales bacterium]
MPRSSLEQIDGRVETIRFVSSDFTVANFALLRGRVVTIVGDLAAIEEGQTLTLHGRFTSHPKHGEQFRVDYFHPLVARSRDGIQRFLMEEVPGIGKSLARQLVAYFYPFWGDDMLERLLDEPHRLDEMPGLGEQRIDAIVDTLREKYGNQKLLVSLYEQGLSAKEARRILDFYAERGVDALRIFEETPFQIAQDVEGIGFKTIDQIAQQRGMPLDDPGRIQAAIVYLLQREYYGNGHLYLPEEPLLRGLSEIVWLGQPPDEAVDLVGDALEQLRNQRYIQIVAVDETLAFYGREAWLAEEAIVGHLQRLLDATLPPLHFGQLTMSQVRQSAEARADLLLDPTQRQAFEVALQSGVSVITGGPGTGKSTLARLIVDSWEEAGLDVKLAAPTGRAARRLAETTGREASTIHRLLEWSRGDFQRNEGDPLDAAAILIDESSMLDAPLASALLRAVPSGCRLLLMGDVDQLPSVGPGRVLHDVIASGELPVARLTQIHRQDTAQENLIVEMAHAINNAPRGQPIAGGPRIARELSAGNVFLFNTHLPWARCSCGDVRLAAHCPGCGGGEVVALLNTEERGAALVQSLVTERIPRTFGVPSAEVQVIAPRYSGPLGVDLLNHQLRAALNPARADRPEFSRGERIFRLGDRVMAIRNNYEKEVVNGLQGTIIDVEPSALAVTVQFDDDVSASFRKEELDQLTHAYAITAHKSQGGEFPAVLLALDPAARRLLYRQLFYTAVTRAKQLLVMVGDPTVLARATANDKPRHRWSGIAHWLREGMA